jgi:hypothetical protein
MRLRPLLPVAVGLVLGASLLRTSIAGGYSGRPAGASLRFRSAISTTDAPAVSGGVQALLAGPVVWAVPAPKLAGFRTVGPPAPAWASAAAPAPNGLVQRLVVATVGVRRPRPFLTNAVTVGQLLRAIPVHLAASDVVRPGLRTNVYTGLRVRVVRIRTRIRTVSESVPFPTLIRYSKELPPGMWKILAEGSDGRVTLTYRVRYRNGKVVRRILLAAAVLTRSVPRIEVRGSSVQPQPSGIQYGQASWYGCSGDYAAHLSLPKGTVVTVTNLDNGRAVTVIINDRGPYGVPGRIIDLCSTAFAQIAPLAQGVANVEITW